MRESLVLFIVVPLFMAALGLFLGGLGIVWLRRERAFTRDGVRAEGMVIGFERRRYARGRNLRQFNYRDHPVVRYTTREGQEAQFESPVGTLPRLHREGQPVPVLYNPTNPAEGRIATGGMQFGAPIFLIIIGLAMALFAGFFAIGAWIIAAQLPAG